MILKSQNGAKYPTNIISETGWPTQGGNDCGTGAKCPTKTQGAVAGIDELNQFMDGWVCQSMANGTTYFWFEAFDVSTVTGQDSAIASPRNSVMLVGRVLDWHAWC